MPVLSSISPPSGGRRDHLTVNGGNQPFESLDALYVGFGREHHRLRPNGTAVRRYRAACGGAHPGALEQPHALAPDRLCEATGKTGRVDGGKVGREDARTHAIDGQVPCGVAGVEQFVVGWAEPQRAEPIDHSPHHRLLLSGGGHHVVAFPGVVTVDLFGLADLADPVDRPDHVLLHGDGGITRCGIGHPLLEPVVNATKRTAVAPGGAIARGLGLEHDDVDVGDRALEVIGSPQAAEARADDDDVAGDVSVKGRAAAPGTRESSPTSSFPGGRLFRGPIPLSGIQSS